MNRRRMAVFLLAAVMAGTAGCGRKGEENAGAVSYGKEGAAIEAAVYPEMAPYPYGEGSADTAAGEDGSAMDSEGYDRWLEDKERFSEVPEEDIEAVGAFAVKSARQFLSGAEEENRVYSPVSAYMALAMLAETAGGESQAQILRLLGADDTENLREGAAAVWRACYSDDGALTSILANSIWLREGMSYRRETLKRLAEDYYASSYSGVMGSEEYNRELQRWLDEQTGGLLRGAGGRRGAELQDCHGAGGRRQLPCGLAGEIF